MRLQYVPHGLDPGDRGVVFRRLGGNFYANVFASLGEILGFFTVR